MATTCVAVGPADPDIAGLGIIIALAFQSGTSVLLSAWLFITVDLVLIVNFKKWLDGPYNKQPGKGRPRRGSRGSIRSGDQVVPQSRGDGQPPTLAELEERQAGIRECLTFISDSQILTGTGLLIAALATRDRLSLYHFHIIYDIANFTA
ncbi:hypothetical protein B0T24DRAFT_112390 [Lasiosphaeria ovina]|uniref:Uncharacterized protein n=1 Tax=Lasiosphaeria ovina TaxID=92902 RepID=A0AAE0JUB1_9PEZI|nr:hypothetical protein B0T24DRAFT_112390 [Lasiosphaeria ovina]